MPTVKRFGSASIKIYADDHNPPHFHIVGPDFQVIVNIQDLTLTGGKASEKQIAEAMAWAAENTEMLILKWIESCLKNICLAFFLLN
jgi:hypothetical protein